MKLTFIRWLHWQEFIQTVNPKADFWVRYLRIGRFMILWDAPKNREPNRTAVLRTAEPTKLRKKEKP